MIGHLGNRVSALLDGQLSVRETEEAWAHVYACHACRDLVEREGWVKTRLAGLCDGQGQAPSGLKGSLLSMPPGDALLAADSAGTGPRRHTGVLVGGGALGAAMVGVLAFGILPGATPPADRRPPTTQINTSIPVSPGPSQTPVQGQTAPISTSLSGLLPAPVRRMLP